MVYEEVQMGGDKKNNQLVVYRPQPHHQGYRGHHGYHGQEVVPWGNGPAARQDHAAVIVLSVVLVIMTGVVLVLFALGVIDYRDERWIGCLPYNPGQEHAAPGEPGRGGRRRSDRDSTRRYGGVAGWFRSRTGP